MGYSEKYDKLNSFYLEMWSHLDQFFPEGRWLDVGPYSHPELGTYARHLTVWREETALGEKLDAKLFGVVAERSRARATTKEEFLKTVGSIDAEMRQRLRQIELAGISPEEKGAAEQDVDELSGLLYAYGKMDSDVAGWLEQARKLKERIGDRALDYSGRIYSSEHEVWED